MNAGGSILLKIGARQLGDLSGLALPELIFKLITNFYLIGGITLFALNVISYFLALSRINLSIAYPIMVTGGIVIITLFSYFALKENLTILQISGLALVIAGIALVTWQTA